jgi:hypothetical protein
VLRCEGKGRVFGPRSRWWAVSVIALTGVLSTAAAFLAVTAAHHLPKAILGLGVLVPSSLWSAKYARAAPSDGTRTGTPRPCG